MLASGTAASSPFLCENVSISFLSILCVPVENVRGYGLHRLPASSYQKGGHRPRRRAEALNVPHRTWSGHNNMASGIISLRQLRVLCYFYPYPGCVYKPSTMVRVVPLFFCRATHCRPAYAAVGCLSRSCIVIRPQLLWNSNSNRKPTKPYPN